MKREKAYVEARRNKIKLLLRENDYLSVEALSKMLDVSLMTIRRDLAYLEEKRVIKRTHGGALGILSEEEDLQIYRKKIARFAAEFIEDDDTIFINTSSTALKVINFIKKRHITVITNNARAINEERAKNVNIILTGGELRRPKYAMVGDFALRSLQPIYAKKVFVGCSGISVESGVTTEIFSEVNINEMMIDHAIKQVFILADHTKLGKNSSFVSCPISKVNCIITDEKASDEQVKAFVEKGIKVYRVRKNE